MTWDARAGLECGVVRKTLKKTSEYFGEGLYAANASLLVGSMAAATEEAAVAVEKIRPCRRKG